MVVDCQALAEIVNGGSPLSDDNYVPMFRRIASSLAQLLCQDWRPARDCDDPVEWRMREWNRQADFVVNEAMDSGAAMEWSDLVLLSNACYRNVLVFSDGGLRRPSGRAAAGWVAYVREDAGFRMMAYAAQPLGGVASAFAAEAIALEMAVSFLVTLAMRRNQ